MFASKTKHTVPADERLPATVFSSAADQTRKIAYEHIIMSLRLVVGQQQHVNHVFPLSIRRDIERGGLTFVESRHVDGDVFVHTFELGDVLDG